MGAMHAGHVALMEAAREDCASVAVSIFVNPTQFSESAEFAGYPRDVERDLEACERSRVDLVWVPEESNVYGETFQTFVDPGAVSEPLEGAFRPGHFRGVATVVSKLFNVFEPDFAYFGQKDWQQTRVVAALIADLDFDVRLAVVPTVREADGLALSSRNSRLKPADRPAAGLLYSTLNLAAELLEGGESDAGRLRSAMLKALGSDPRVRIDYVSVADAMSLEELERVREPVVISCAAHVGGVRLIDNLVFGVELRLSGER